MELFKKILKWVGIALAILLGLFVLVIIMMTIFPSFKIFGHSYMGMKSYKSNETKYSLNQSEEYNIYLNTQNFDIEIAENKKTNEVIISYEDGTWGFVTVANSQITTTNNDKTIEIRMTEPQGLVWGNGVVKILLPTDDNNTYWYYITLQTTGGDISINHRHLAGISVNMGDGAFLWKAEQEVPIEEEKDKEQDEEQNENSGSWTPDTNDTNNTNDTEKKTKIVPVTTISTGHFIFFGNKAKINLDCFEYIYIVHNDDFISSGEEHTTMHSKMLISNSTLDLNLKGLTGSIQFNCKDINLKTDFLFDYDEFKVFANNGSINIGKINFNEEDFISNMLSNHATIITDSANVIIGESNAYTNISTTSGSVQVTKANNYLAVESVNGSISVTNAYKDINLNTHSGNITINAYYAGAKITTDTGSIYAYNKGEESSINDTKIIQNKGNITIISENNEISITSRNGSNITATFRKMCQNSDITHSIINTYGTTQIYILVANLPFKVRATGTVSGELGRNVTMSSSTEYITYNPANVILEQYSTLNVDGGIIKFTGIYE